MFVKVSENCSQVSEKSGKSGIFLVSDEWQP